MLFSMTFAVREILECIGEDPDREVRRSSLENSFSIFFLGSA